MSGAVKPVSAPYVFPLLAWQTCSIQIVIATNFLQSTLHGSSWTSLSHVTMPSRNPTCTSTRSCDSRVRWFKRSPLVSACLNADWVPFTNCNKTLFDQAQMRHIYKMRYMLKFGIATDCAAYPDNQSLRSHLTPLCSLFGADTPSAWVCGTTTTIVAIDIVDV